MTTVQPDVEILKSILENMNDPERLNLHPWTSRLFVKEAVERNPHLRRESPGRQLITALGDLFSRMMPGTPPRRGKRLDTHWGEFGILAARYFAPLQFGAPIPISLRDAWGRIDPAILYCVYGKPIEALAEEQIKLYQLVGPDLEYACASTLSDWHKKGLQRFTEFILNRERFLSRTPTQASIISKPQIAGAKTQLRVKAKRWFWLAVTLLFVLAIGLGVFKISKIYKSGVQVYQDVTQMQGLMESSIEIKTIQTTIPILRRLQADLSSFKQEARPLLWLGPKLNWLPVYGHDLAVAPGMIELAEHLIKASIYVCDAAQPALNRFDSQGSSLDPASLTALLVQAGPSLGHAREELDRALALRKSINVEHLSPRIHNILIDQLDPMLKLADESLSLGAALPSILGAANDGPKTYLLLVQNEDELRPTGGFITSVGNLVIYNGRIISLDFESVDNDAQEDWSEPYPSAPWQLQEYMNSRVLILRDANWFTDFPTTVLWAEYLYAYTHSHSVDGVIAFDQHFLVMLLKQLGPLEVEGVAYPITDENVIEYMRESKRPPAGETLPANWNRKDFIGKIAASVLKKIDAGNQNWPAIAGVFSQALDQRHLLLQFDNPVVASLTVEHGWDNAVRPGTGDFLMVTDTNIGFNKTNAAVDISLTYDIDLSDLDAPLGTLTLTHQNHADQTVPCIHWDTEKRITGEEWYPIDRCYWSYLRVYKQSGVQLLNATPHQISGDWMILGQSIPARVDKLDEEEIAGVQGFGTLLVVPGGETLSTSFQFALPRTVLSSQANSNELTLHLKVQKQPGTLENPLTIRVHFPKHAVLKSILPGAIVQNDDLMLKTNLLTDVELDIVFTIP